MPERVEFEEFWISRESRASLSVAWPIRRCECDALSTLSTCPDRGPFVKSNVGVDCVSFSKERTLFLC